MPKRSPFPSFRLRLLQVYSPTRILCERVSMPWGYVRLYGAAAKAWLKAHPNARPLPSTPAEHADETAKAMARHERRYGATTL